MINDNPIQLKQLGRLNINIDWLNIADDIKGLTLHYVKHRLPFMLYNKEDKSFTCSSFKDGMWYTLTSEGEEVGVYQHSDEEQLFNTIKLSMVGNREFIGLNLLEDESKYLNLVKDAIWKYETKTTTEKAT